MSTIRKSARKASPRHQEELLSGEEVEILEFSDSDFETFVEKPILSTRQIKRNSGNTVELQERQNLNFNNSALNLLSEIWSIILDFLGNTPASLFSISKVCFQLRATSNHSPTWTKIKIEIIKQNETIVFKPKKNDEYPDRTFVLRNLKTMCSVCYCKDTSLKKAYVDGNSVKFCERCFRLKWRSFSAKNRNRYNTSSESDKGTSLRKIGSFALGLLNYRTVTWRGDYHYRHTAHMFSDSSLQLMRDFIYGSCTLEQSFLSKQNAKKKENAVIAEEKRKNRLASVKL